MTDVYKTMYLFEETHVCFVCGDKIELTAQVCSRFCMRALEQLTELKQLETAKEALQQFSEQRSEPTKTEAETHVALDDTTY
jgi:hypothetical protein